MKRARQVRTITPQLVPQSDVGVVGPLRVPEARSSLRRRRVAQRAWMPETAGGWIVLITFSLFGAAFGATAYLAIEEITAQAPGIGMVAAADPDTRVSLAPVVDAMPTGGASIEVDPVSARVSDAAPVLDESMLAPIDRDKPAPRKSASPKSSIARSAASRASQPASTRAEDATIAPDAAAQAPPPIIASAAIEAKSPRIDRWETMSAAIATCSRESFLAGAVCAERVRLQYCEGFWGEVPQCRAATRPGASR